MVEYLKTKKGYFYKLLKNGERKRISQEEYNRKNKKMIGGFGKTKQEIIDELINKKEEYYDDWLRSGSKFGKIYKNSIGKDPYTDIDGGLVYVNEVITNYEVEPDIEYIALFGPFNPRKKTSKILQKEMEEKVQKNIYLRKKEIIDEIKDKKKYNIWVKLGSKFGKIYKNGNKGYLWWDINGELVLVNEDTTNYKGEPDVKYIPVFGPYNPNEESPLKKNFDIQMEKKVKIIDEVKRDKRKYNNWIEKGGRYGIIEKYGIKKSAWTDVNGKPVKVSYVTSTYNTDTEPDTEQIAVFDWYGPTHNNPYVEQNKYSIVNKDITLSTSGLGSCTALAMIIGNKKFMVHLEARTNVDVIINVIKKIIEEENVDPIILKPYIYYGRTNSSLTLFRSKDICRKLGIPEENYDISSVSPFETVDL
jgi:ribosomal protein S16